jgi:predicted glycosyltransferase
VGYDGYMKLGYLHPNVFTPNLDLVSKYGISEKYAVIRLAKLAAFHDFGIQGITYQFLDKIIEKLEAKKIRVLISNEQKIDPKYDAYLLKINPSDMHHILSYAQMLICDSQSMSVEAAVLGVPSLRYSSFAGKISVLEELEHQYQLTFGIPIGEETMLLNKLDEILSHADLKLIFQERRAKMLEDKIDVTAFLVWFLENFPQSVDAYQKSQNWPLAGVLN